MSASPDTGDTEQARRSNPWVALGFLMTGLTVGVIIMSMSNTELPEIESALDMTNSSAELTWTLFLAGLGAFIVPAGRLADQHGRRRVYVLGGVGMAIFCLLAAAATNGFVLLASRFLQGALSAAIVATAVGLMNVLFTDPRRRGIAFGIFGVAFGAAMALGPIVGGLFSDEGGWRLSFVLGAVVLIAATVGVARTAEESKDPDAPPGADLTGIVLLSIGVVALILALDQGRSYGWPTTTTRPVIAGWTWTWHISIVAVLFAAAAVSLTAFLLVDRARAARGATVLLDPRLLRYERFSLGTVVASLLFAAGLPFFTVFPMFSQAVLGQSELIAGVTIATVGLGIACGSLASAPLGGRYGAPRVVSCGLLLAGVVNIATIPLIRVDARAIELSLTLLVFGLGFGLAYSRVTEVLLADIPAARSSHASGMMFGARVVAGAVGSAFFIAILTLTAVHQAQANVDRDTEATAEQRQEALDLVLGTSAPHYGSSSAGEEGTSIHDVTSKDPPNQLVVDAQTGYVDATRLVLGFTSAMFLLGAILSMLIPSSPRIPDDDRPGAAATVGG